VFGLAGAVQGLCYLNGRKNARPSLTPNNSISRYSRTYESHSSEHHYSWSYSCDPVVVNSGLIVEANWRLQTSAGGPLGGCLFVMSRGEESNPRVAYSRITLSIHRRTLRRLHCSLLLAVWATSLCRPIQCYEWPKFYLVLQPVAMDYKRHTCSLLAESRGVWRYVPPHFSKMWVSANSSKFAQKQWCFEWGNVTEDQLRRDWVVQVHTPQDSGKLHLRQYQIIIFFWGQGGPRTPRKWPSGPSTLNPPMNFRPNTLRKFNHCRIIGVLVCLLFHWCNKSCHLL